MQRVMTLAACTAALIAGALVVAGPLNPPPGPVAPTLKTLAEVEPRIAITEQNTPGDADSQFRITQAGSYYLTGSLAAVGGKHGIEVEVTGAGVTIDLCGFVVEGSVPGGSPASLSAISVTGQSRAVSVRNGTLRGWGGAGIWALWAENCHVDSVRAIQNSGAGIVVGGQSVLTACSAADNGQYGIRAGTGSVVERCTAEGNQDDGIIAGGSSVVRGSAVFFNTGDGVEAGPHSLVEGCAASNNGADGVRCAANARVIGNICNVNGGAGVHATLPANHLDGNTVQGNQRGIDVDTGGNFVVRNTAGGNSTNYAITGTQTIGPIVTAAGTIISTNPWANFEF